MAARKKARRTRRPRADAETTGRLPLGTTAQTKTIGATDEPAADAVARVDELGGDAFAKFLESTGRNHDGRVTFKDLAEIKAAGF